MLKINSSAICLVMAAVLTAGCSDSAKPTANTPGAVASKPTSTAPLSASTATSMLSSTLTSSLTPTIVPAMPYAYNPQGRRDPFTPLIIKEEKKVLAGAKTPLERYALHEFKLSGIVWGGLGFHAMLEGPDGKGYFVKEKTIIGPNRGVVRKITKSSMIIEELYRDPAGAMKKKEIIIELRKKQEGTP